jgi:hypothetical protein
MPRLAAILAALVALAWLAACAVYSSVGLERRKMADFYTVAPQIEWNRYKDSRFESWTIDGPDLDNVLFTEPLGDGDVLYHFPGREDMPQFRHNMSESEVMEFVVDSLAAAGAQKVEALNLAPVPFGSRPGFHFDLTFQNSSGLDKLGSVIGTMKDGKLYLILYTGAAQHYFPKYKPTVDALFASVQT